VIGAKDKKFDVDDWASIVLEYGESKRAICYFDSRSFLPQSAFISFDGGQVHIPEYFWSPENLIKITGPKDYRNPADVERKLYEYPLKDDRFFNYAHSSGFRYEIDHVYDCLKKGMLESDVMPHSDTIEVVEMLDEIRRQLGVVFPHDKK